MPHISFSELKNWAKCAYYHKLVNIDKLKGFVGSEHTAFGSAIHEVCEQRVLGTLPEGKEGELFAEAFEKEIESLLTDGVELKQSLVTEMEAQGKELAGMPVPALSEYFGDYEIVSAEEPMEGFEYLFKGFIDLVVKTTDGKYHILDWKTTSWGWDARRRADPMVTYQLTLYKNYFARKHDIDPKMIETHFALIKRTAKKNHVEIFRVTSGPRKTQNALKLLNKAVYNIQKKNHIKNRLSCRGCEFHNTEYCR
jgi:hypothetical protein